MQTMRCPCKLVGILLHIVAIVWIVSLIRCDVRDQVTAYTQCAYLSSEVHVYAPLHGCSYVDGLESNL